MTAMRSTTGFLASLPAQQRLTLLLIYAEKFDYVEAGRVLDISADVIAAAVDPHQRDVRRPAERYPTARKRQHRRTLSARGERIIMTELSDELLVAYVDGQLARKQTHAVEKVLEQDDVIARRVKALQDAHSRLEAAFEAILAGEELVVAKPERAGVLRALGDGGEDRARGCGTRSRSRDDDRRLRLAAQHARLRALIFGPHRSGIHRKYRANMARDRRPRARAAQPREPRSRS